MNIGEQLGILPPTALVIRKLLPEVVECANPDLIIGIEFEVENVGDMDSAKTEYVKLTEDNSLRNHGIEFITPPAKYREVVYIAENLFKRNKFTAENYSERCSTHVHVNCTNLTFEQLASALMLYQVFEKMLYNFIGNNRDENIFCVPWSETQLNYSIVDALLTTGSKSLRTWQKYTGLNLLPLFHQGTVEFRQMHGHCDLELLKTWLNIIGALFLYAEKNNVAAIRKDLIGLNTTSEYEQIVNRVFGRYADNLFIGNYRDALEDGVISMKYSLAGEKITPVESMDFRQQAEEDEQRLEDADIQTQRRVRQQQQLPQSDAHLRRMAENVNIAARPAVILRQQPFVWEPVQPIERAR